MPAAPVIKVWRNSLRLLSFDEGMPRSLIRNPLIYKGKPDERGLKPATTFWVTSRSPFLGHYAPASGLTQDTSHGGVFWTLASTYLPNQGGRTCNRMLIANPPSLGNTDFTFTR